MEPNYRYIELWRRDELEVSIVNKSQRIPVVQMVQDTTREDIEGITREQYMLVYDIVHQMNPQPI